MIRFHPSRSVRRLAGLLVLPLLFGTAHAALTTEEVARLGKDLTPLGAERAGNAAGTIPAWTGGLTRPPAGFDIKQGHANPYAGEKPLYTVTAQNWEQYKNVLSDGHVAMLKRYPESYRLDVYPTHRSAALPQAEYDRIREQAGKITVTASGTGLENWDRSAVPFPVPKNGLEAIWNHLVRSRAGGIERRHLIGAVNPNGSFNAYGVDESWIFAQNMDRQEDNRFWYFMARMYSPADVTGEVVMVHEPLDFARDGRLAWVYNAGLRRVRRAPQIIYDSPGSFSEGTRTEDDYDMFNGPADRYDWKLVGKKEIYVPYNAYKLQDPAVKNKDLLTPLHINPEYLRYELHRVWVVDATLKAGERHIYKRRTFYVDEDSWQILLVDQYDNRDQLWRVSEGHAMNFYNVPAVWTSAEVHTDLQAGRYLVMGLFSENPVHEFGIKRTEADFSPDALRTEGVR